MTRSALSSLSFALTVFGALGAAHAQETLVVSTATSVQEGLFAKLEKPFTAETGVQIKFQKSARRQPTEYVKEVLEGKSEVAIMALTFEDVLADAKKEGFNIPADQVTQRVVGRDLLDVIVNKGTGVTKLTLEQVADLFSGKVKNWKQVGGADVPVTIMLAADKAPGRATFRKLAMKNVEFTKDAQEVATQNEMFQKIDSTPGAVSYSSSKSPHANSVHVETPAIGRPITLVTKGRPSANAEKLINFIRTNAEKLGIGKT